MTQRKTCHNLLVKGKLKDNILIDTSYYYYPNKSIKTRVVYKSNNYSEFDSVKLGLQNAEGIYGIFQQDLLTNGIILKVTEFNSKGVQVKEENFEE